MTRHMQVMSMSALGNLEKMPAYIPESRNLKRVYEKKRHDLLRYESAKTGFFFSFIFCYLSLTIIIIM